MVIGGGDLTRIGRGDTWTCLVGAELDLFARRSVLLQLLAVEEVSRLYPTLAEQLLRLVVEVRRIRPIALAQGNHHVRLRRIRQNYDLRGCLPAVPDHFFADFVETYRARRGHAGIRQRAAAYRIGMGCALSPNPEQGAEGSVRRELGSEPRGGLVERCADLVVGQRWRRLQRGTPRFERSLEHVEGQCRP